MSNVLALASDFIERMCNPAYGIRENENYTMRFGELLASDGFSDELRKEIAHLRDARALSPHGWLWLLKWSDSQEVQIDDHLLLKLAETHSSVFMQVATIASATRKSDWLETDATYPLRQFPNPWLRALMSNCTLEPEPQEEAERTSRIDTKRCESLLIALMQVGSPVTLGAASALLNHQWTGQKGLLEFFWEIAGELDSGTRREWVERLKPPPNDEDRRQSRS